jgi:phosphate transport system permease protein
MVLPVLIRTTEESLQSVPEIYREGALALGATKLRIIFTILLPNALSGILTAIILSIGRIVGESAALIFTSGIVYRMPDNIFGHIFSSGRTLTLHLYQLAVLGEPLEQSFATASVLLMLVLLINILAKRIIKVFQK